MRYKMKCKELRIDKFLGEMDAVVPWDALISHIKPYYQGFTEENKSRGGRPSHGTELMLRIHFLQLWHNLSDPAMEEAIYDRLSFQNFLGFDCFGGAIPDESSILRFRHLLEKHKLSEQILEIINTYLDIHGLVLRAGTIVDATLLQAPVSKKNKAKSRDLEMSSTRKNNKWYFGAKGHIGVQANGKPIIHSVAFSTAKDHDLLALECLLHGGESSVFGDSAYNVNDDKRQARSHEVYYGISDKGRRNHPLSHAQKKKNRKYSSLRAKVEHPFRVIKEQWGHRKLRYKGLMKNASQFTTLCALTNLYLCRKQVISMG